MLATVRGTTLIIIIFALLLFSEAGAVSHIQIAENSWVTRASMHIARSDLEVAVVNGNIYAIGGSGNGSNEEYNPGTDSWTFKAPMPTARSDFGIAVCQNKIYCIGGTTGFSDNTGFVAKGTNEVYDPATDTWETKAPLPTARFN